MSNPIYSHDLYTPGGKDMLALLKQELVAIQSEIRATEAIARQLKKTLSEGKATPAQVVAAATQAEKIASQKRLLLARENAQAQRIHNTTLKQQAIHEQQVAAATSRANIARQREIDYANRAATANKSHSSSLKGLIGSIRNLAYAYFSLGAATQVFQSILKQTKALDTLTVAFNTTLGSAQATAQAQEYLLDISERFGANLLGASQAYLKFSAASTQAGVSAEETQKIFTSVTKASSILGLGAERTSYVFLALEQIMSKGRLSTEELRRQLGEHLPGAFGIAAEAMGVTTAKLTDMLKKGEIASTDFLPKFAVQLEKAYGIDQVERIDNLAAAQERFNNELTLLIDKFDLSKTFKGFFNTLANGARYIRENIDLFIELGKTVLYFVAALGAYKIGAAIAAAYTQRLTLQVRILTAAMKANPFGIFLSVIVLLLPEILKLIRHINGVSDATYAMRDAIEAMNESFASEYASVTKTLKVYSDANSTLKERQAAYDTLNAAYPDILKNYDLEQRRVEDLTKAQEELRSAIIDRIAGEALDESNKQLFSELQKASQFTPGFFSLYNKNSNGLGVGEEDIANARKKESEIAIADAKQRADVIRQTAEQMKTLRSEELDALTKIDELEGRASGRSFGQLDQQMQLNEAKKAEVEITKILDKFNQKELEAVVASKEGSILRRKIAAELLASKFPSKGGGGDEGDTKTRKDPRIEALDRLAELNKLEEDSLDKKIAAVTLAYQKEKVIHENDTEYILALKEQFYRDLFQVETEFYQEEIEGYERSEEQKKAAFKKATEDVKAYLDDRRKAIEDEENKRQANVDFFRDEFSARREHEKAIFDLTTHTKEETLAFELKLKEDELNDELQLHRTFGKVLSDEEVKRVTELRDRTKAARVAGGIVGDLQGFFHKNNGGNGGDKDEETDIFSLLGIDFGGDDEKLDAFKQTIDFVGGELSNFLDFQKEIVDQQIDNADRLVRNAENNLNRQIALAAANQANNVAGAQAELALAKKTQEEALKLRKKTQKQELALDTLAQSSNLITAISAALKLGPILGPIAVGAILATFAASKIKALQLINKKTFRKGGYETIGGGSHESGNDTHVGGNNWAEKDESVGIFTAKATRKYKPSLKAIVNAANKGTLENILVQDRRAIQGINMTNRLDVDTSLMEKRLTRLVSLSETKTFVDGRGRLVRIDRGRTTIINR